MQIRPVIASLVLAACGLAQTLTVSPAGFAAAEGNSNNAFPFNATTIRRYMQIHGDLGTTPMLITKLSFRVNASTTNYTGTKTFDMELFMGEGNPGSTTAPSFTYANNYFLPAVNVIPRGSITFGPTGQAISPGPNPFTSMDLPLATPSRTPPPTRWSGRPRSTASRRSARPPSWTPTARPRYPRAR